jgi:hypothetical protein
MLHTAVRHRGRSRCIKLSHLLVYYVILKLSGFQARGVVTSKAERGKEGVGLTNKEGLKSRSIDSV